jgi:hypothetical protein
MPDAKRLIAEVAARLGISLGTNDPALVLVTLNELILDEAMKKAVDNVRVGKSGFRAGLRTPGRMATLQRVGTGDISNSYA